MAKKTKGTGNKTAGGPKYTKEDLSFNFGYNVKGTGKPPKPRKGKGASGSP